MIPQPRWTVNSWPRTRINEVTTGPGQVIGMSGQSKESCPSGMGRYPPRHLGMGRPVGGDPVSPAQVPWSPGRRARFGSTIGAVTLEHAVERVIE